MTVLEWASVGFALAFFVYAAASGWKARPGNGYRAADHFTAVKLRGSLPKFTGRDGV